MENFILSESKLRKIIRSVLKEHYQAFESLAEEELLAEGIYDPGILKAVFMAGGPGCFVEDTLVKTEDGYKKISEVLVGDNVFTINEETKETELKPVIQTHKYDVHTEDLLELEFEGGYIVRCTENHKFYVDGEWVKAKDLNVELALLNLRLLRKTNLGKCDQPVYDLTVEDNSNYKITEKDIIVHNSGKSFTAKALFGADPKSLNSTATATGLKLVNSDPAFEKYLKDLGIDPKTLAAMSDEEWKEVTEKPGGPRMKAKEKKKKFEKLYTSGHLGLIIDGTGAQYYNIERQKRLLESLGYDTYMVFVNTSLEVAMDRNRKRDRVLKDDLVRDSWQAVQNNLGAFQELFGQSNFTIVDNTVYGPIPGNIEKAVMHFVNSPIKNRIGREWIESELGQRGGGTKKERNRLLNRRR
jgi:hypothetical protein